MGASGVYDAYVRGWDGKGNGNEALGCLRPAGWHPVARGPISVVRPPAGAASRVGLRRVGAGLVNADLRIQRLPVDTARQFRAEAARLGVTYAELLARLLDEYQNEKGNK